MCVSDASCFSIVGVYLPSNPDSVVLEIDYKSGTPMQRYDNVIAVCKYDVIWGQRSALACDTILHHDFKVL